MKVLGTICKEEKNATCGHVINGIVRRGWDYIRWERCSLVGA